MMRVLIAAAVLFSCAVSAPLQADDTRIAKPLTDKPAVSKPVVNVKATPPQIRDAWISEAPPVAKNNAAYITVQNGNVRDALTGVESPVAAKAELHQMSMAGGLMRMQRLPLINLAPDQQLVFGPGGRHIMLIGMKQPLQVGDKVPLTLVFRKAGRLTVQAEVRQVLVDGQSAPAHQDDSSAHHH